MRAAAGGVTQTGRFQPAAARKPAACVQRDDRPPAMACIVDGDSGHDGLKELCQDNLSVSPCLCALATRGGQRGMHAGQVLEIGGAINLHQRGQSRTLPRRPHATPEPMRAAGQAFRTCKGVQPCQADRTASRPK